MKRETLEKIRNILERLFELFIFILIILITFGSLHVHAAESSTIYTYTLDLYNDLPSKQHSEFHYTYNTPYSKVVAYRYQTSGNFEYYTVRYYDQTDNGLFTLSDSVCTWHSEGKFYMVDGLDYSDDNNSNHFATTFQTGVSGSGSSAVTSTYKASFPVFDSMEHALAYCVSGDTTGILNGSSFDNPDFKDTAYAFTGFTANSKMTATWTGTTERSYLKDEDVEEYVRVSYGFAAKDAPDSIKQVDNDSKEYSTAAKSLTVKVSDLVPDDDSWFLRYVQVVPCYRQAGLGAWGDFYHGESSYVYFNADGSIDKIVAPYVKGSLSADMERPVIVLHEAANGNPTESDYSYFEFNNAREDYFSR